MTGGLARGGEDLHQRRRVERCFHRRGHDPADYGHGTEVGRGATRLARPRRSTPPYGRSAPLVERDWTGSEASDRGEGGEGSSRSGGCGMRPGVESEEPITGAMEASCKRCVRGGEPRGRKEALCGLERLVLGGGVSTGEKLALRLGVEEVLHERTRP